MSKNNGASSDDTSGRVTTQNRKPYPSISLINEPVDKLAS